MGIVEITDCEPVDPWTVEHQLKDSFALDVCFYHYYWKLANSIKFAIPLPYKPPRGAVVWSKTELPEGYLKHSTLLSFLLVIFSILIAYQGVVQ